MFKWHEKLEENAFNSHTLILPAVSPGNVGQLVVDVLLMNIQPKPKNIGRIFHPSLEPVVATYLNSDGTTGVTTPCEIYHQKESKLLIMQFFSPVFAQKRSDFVEFLVNWIKLQNFTQVLCLTSSFASERIDSQLVGSPFRYLATSNLPDKIKELLSRNSCKMLESRQFPAPAAHGSNLEDSKQDSAYIPGSGITKLLFEACCTNDIPFVSAIMFASDGCSLTDVLRFYELANTMIQSDNRDAKQQDISKLVVPEYWRNGTLQEVPPTEIF